MTVPAATDLLRSLEEATASLRAANDELYGLNVDLHGGVDATTGEVVGGIVTEYEATYDRELIRIEEHALRSGVRVPAADLRGAKARLRIRESEPELVIAFTEKTARAEALGRWIAGQKAVISGLQSVLRGERE
jgi:hypothetical protein